MENTRIADANVITERYMDSILIEERFIDSAVADTKIKFMGGSFDMPVILEHLDTDEEYLKYLAYLKENL